jgi:hypothetical protein
MTEEEEEEEGGRRREEGGRRKEGEGGARDQGRCFRRQCTSAHSSGAPHMPV